MPLTLCPYLYTTSATRQVPHLFSCTNASPGRMQYQAHTVIRNSLRMSKSTSKDSTLEFQPGTGLHPSVVDLVFNSMTHGSFFLAHQIHLSDLRSPPLHLPLACSARDGIIHKTPITFFLLFPFLPAPPYKTRICTHRTISQCLIIRCLFLPLSFGFDC